MAPPDRSSRPQRSPRPDRTPRPGGGARRPDPPAPLDERGSSGGRPGGRMVVYGRNPVREALRGRRRVHTIWATEPATSAGWLPANVRRASAEEIERRCGSDAHQGVCAEVDPYPYADAKALLADSSPVLVVLDEISDPQNLGAICRSAEGAGATGVILPERRAADVTPAVCKASAGAVEHLPIAQVRNVADFLGEAKAAGCWCYGAAAEAHAAYDGVDWTGPVALVLGAEGRGLRPRVAASCDALVSLPMAGRIESLNVSATAAIVLYEILQQRSRP